MASLALNIRFIAGPEFSRAIQGHAVPDKFDTFVLSTLYAVIRSYFNSCHNCCRHSANDENRCSLVTVSYASRRFARHLACSERASTGKCFLHYRARTICYLAAESNCSSIIARPRDQEITHVIDCRPRRDELWFASICAHVFSSEANGPYPVGTRIIYSKRFESS